METDTMDKKASRAGKPTAVADLEARITLLKKNGIRFYEDGQLRIVFDPKRDDMAIDGDPSVSALARLVRAGEVD